MSDSWPRRRLLAILRGASEPLDAQELARITGQHVTTVRFHLDVLTKESLVRQFQQPPRGRGRPRIGYRAVQRTLGYQELAQVLAEQLGPDSRSRSEAAVAAGRAWGAKLDAEERRIETLADVREVTVGLLSELGFAPERDPSGEESDQVVIRMTGCPLRDLARTHTDVVCGVHLGLIEEVLDRSGERGAVNVRLHPFVEPELCVARLELARRAAVPIGAENEAEPALTPPSAGRVAPQLRNTDPNVAKQSAQQW
ncbi:transcriptional regulator [Nocardia farcinica]|uniref:Transcriptional regulator n=1 Tax=Nocardia farcinica TaxID=37329 RepID=A0A0H5NU45_NOCFR|nr:MULTISPECIES: transcriptional regulator [Nocardia]AXK86260.1 transcriptional regulator [Nocardia farcinica]MBF6069571.1 transcriptional regulator [Nocardia farcinica]MBF6143012.1 transcriptional regulator [Nocardia farcinica]MBF6187912.1 transcriptional regulator [Nocardia farcinica]MBF6232490.1 transcriptional regulator [Nocardia farcinica]